MSPYELQPEHDHPLSGKVLAPEPIQYEIFDHFGIGYNIRVTGPGGSGSLRLLRDYAGAAVKTPTGNYDMSAEGAFSAKGEKVIEMTGQTMVTESDDFILLALFSVHHHFCRCTGPFARGRA
jgi:hypothetical protein